MKTFARILTILTLALIPAIAEAQPRKVLVANLGACAAGSKGVMRIVTDGTGVTDCATGGGSAIAVCLCDGSSWAAQIASTATLVTGAASSIDSQIALFSSTGGKTLKTAGAATIAANPAFVAGQVGVGTTGFIFEGATADTIESLLTVADPASSDKTWTIPNATGTFVLSTLATNAPDAANSVTGASNALVFEGATADEFEISVSPADPGVDVTITLPATTGTVALVGGFPTTATGSAAAGGANVSEVTITVKDAAGATVAAVHHLDVWLSDAASCAGLTGTSASGTVQAKAASGVDLQVYSAKKAVRVQTLATGVYILEITDSAKTGFIACAAVNGKAVAIDTLVAGDYGA